MTQFPGYELDKELARGPLGGAWLACGAGQPGAVVIESCAVDAAYAGPSGPYDHVARFFASKSRQRKLATATADASGHVSRGGGHVVAVHDLQATTSGGFAASDPLTFSAADLVALRASLPPFLLFRLVAGVVHTLRSIGDAEFGRPHGALTPRSIVIDDARGVERWRVGLRDPAPGDEVDAAGDAGRVADMRALGELIYRLVERKPFRRLGGYPIVDENGAWAALGPKGTGWLALANRLLNPDAIAGSVRLEDVSAEVDALRAKPKRTKELVYAGTAAGLLVVAGGVVGGAILLQETGPTAPFNEDGFQAWAESYDAWYGGAARAASDLRSDDLDPESSYAGIAADPYLREAFFETIIRTLDVDDAGILEVSSPTASLEAAGAPNSLRPDQTADLLNEIRTDFPELFMQIQDDTSLGGRVQLNLGLVGGRVVERTEEEIASDPDGRTSFFDAEAPGSLATALDAEAWADRALLLSGAELFEGRGWTTPAEELRRVEQQMTLDGPGAIDDRSELEEIEAVLAAATEVTEIEAFYAERAEIASAIEQQGEATESAGSTGPCGGPRDPVLAAMQQMLDAELAAAAAQARVGTATAFEPFPQLRIAMDRTLSELDAIRAFVGRAEGGWSSVDREYFDATSETLTRVRASGSVPTLEDAASWLAEASSGDFDLPDASLDPRRSDPRFAAVRDVQLAFAQDKVDLWNAQYRDAFEEQRVDVEASLGTSIPEEISQLRSWFADVAGRCWKRSTRAEIEENTALLIDRSEAFRATMQRLANNIEVKYDELVPALRAERVVVGAGEIDAIDAYWNERRDALLADSNPQGEDAEREEAARLLKVTNELRDRLVEIGTAITAVTFRPFEAAPSGFTAAPLASLLAEQREQAADAVARDAVTLGDAIEDLQVWTGETHIAVGALAAAERIADAGYLPSEAGGGGDRWPTIESVTDAVTAYRSAAPRSRDARVDEAFGPMWQRIERLLALQSENDPAALAAAAAPGSADAIESKRAAYARLTDLDTAWPGNPADLATDIEARQGVEAAAGGIEPAGRRDAVIADLTQAAQNRWRSAMASAKDSAAVRAVLARLGDSRLSAGDLRGIDRWNARLFEIDRGIDTGNRDDQAVQSAIGSLLPSLEEALAGVPAGDRPSDARSFIRGLEELRDRRLSSADEFNPQAVGPGQSGWTFSGKGDEFSYLDYRSPAGTTVRFIRTTVDPTRPDDALFLASTEVSVGLFIEVLGPTPPGVEPDGDSWAGPRAWSWSADRGFAVGQRWLMNNAQWENDPPAPPYPPAINGTIEPPTAAHPMTDVSFSVVRAFAERMGCELPTAAQWEAAYRQHASGVPAQQWNLRDATWAQQYAWTTSEVQAILGNEV
ncbi:MAG: SUMF1/EgtB/PvdO family nonheme iron enzyme, partial [Planctomycetota bacterium]